MTARLVPCAAGPEHADEAAVMFSARWPEFIFHDAGAAAYVRRKDDYFADLDFYLVEDSRLVGGCWAVPIAWDGSVDELPSGYTASLARAVDGHDAGIAADTLVVMAAAISSAEQGRGLAGVALSGLRAVAADRGLARVIAPVRPTLKSRYPLIPIATYAGWANAGGEPFDPWIRTHVRLGATVVAVTDHSQTIRGTVADWESWTGLTLPGPGSYVIPSGLDVLSVYADGTGIYHEPGVWLRHL